MAIQAFNRLDALKKAQCLEDNGQIAEMISKRILGDSENHKMTAEELMAPAPRVSASGLETRYYKLEKLVKWEHCEEVNTMLLEGVSPYAVSDWCKENGFSISQAKLYEYRKLLREATANHIAVDALLGVGVPNKNKSILMGAMAKKNIPQKVKNEMELLDSLIQLGMKNLSENPDVDADTAMRAINLKNKITGGAHGGLTIYGLDHLRKLEKAKMDAIVDVVKAYVPEDKYDEISEAVERAEREFYAEEAPELLEQYDEETNAQLAGQVEEGVTEDK